MVFIVFIDWLAGISRRIIHQFGLFEFMFSKGERRKGGTTACFWRRRTRSAVAPTASKPKADGSGTGKVTPWKARKIGPPNPEAKVLCAPSGVNSLMSPLP